MYDVLAHPRAYLAGGRDFVRHAAYLWCCGALDAPFDTLLMPVYALAAELPRLELPGLMWRRLEDGAAIVAIDGVDGEVARWIERYPACRYILAGKFGERPDWLLQFSFTCRSSS
jgi:hypothetical protein